MSDTLRRKIFAGCRDLGLDSDTRRDLQLVATGKASMSDMDDADMEKVVDALKERGFKPGIKGGFKPRPKRADLRLIHVLWRLLGEAGELTDPSRNGLNAFIRSRYGKAWGFELLDVDDLREPDQIETVVRTLKQWNLRAETAYNPGEHR